MKKNMNFLLVVLSLSVLTSCSEDETEQTFDGFSNYLKTIGYSFYNPPRTDRGPSSVFRFEKAETGKILISPVCKKLYRSIPISENKLSLPKEASVNEIGLNLATSLINDLFKRPPSLDTNVDYEKSITVSFSDVSSHSINEEDIYTSEGALRSITPSCYSALKNLTDEIKNKNVFVVQDSIRIDSMNYKFKRRNSGKLDVKAEIKNLISFKPSAKFNFKDDITLEIKEPRFVAFKAFLLTNYTPSGFNSAVSARITGSKLSVDEIEKRLNKQ